LLEIVVFIRKYSQQHSYLLFELHFSSPGKLKVMESRRPQGRGESNPKPETLSFLGRTFFNFIDTLGEL
jgi:hypothetical protein